MRLVLKNYLIAAVVLALIGGGATLLTPARAGAQGGRPSTPVQIVGPLPVPVTGSIGFAGTVDVAVTNTPAVSITGTPAVSISGTPGVTVGNAPGNPVNVRNVDNPALQPVEINFDQNMSDGDGQTACPITAYTVPAGKALVIEYANFFGIGPSSPVESLGFSVFGGGSPQYQFITAQRGDSQIGNLFYTGNESLRMYFGPSETVRLCAFRGNTKTGFMTARAKLSGHLVDVP